MSENRNKIIDMVTINDTLYIFLYYALNCKNSLLKFLHNHDIQCIIILEMYFFIIISGLKVIICYPNPPLCGYPLPTLCSQQSSNTPTIATEKSRANSGVMAALQRRKPS